MKFNKYGQENRELSNIENIKTNTKYSLFKKIVKSIPKFVAVVFILFIGYFFGIDMVTSTSNAGIKTMSLGACTIITFPVIMYLILSSRLYKNFKEKHCMLNNIKMILVSLAIAIIINVVVGKEVYNNTSGAITVLIIGIPASVIISANGIILHLRKQKINKALDRHFIVETESEIENKELFNIENIPTKCNECGYKNKVGAKFCNQCGSKLEENHNIENNNETNITSEIIISPSISKKKKIVIGILSTVIFIGCIMIWNSYRNYKYETGYKLTESEKISYINQQLAKNNYDKAEKLVYKYYSKDTLNYLEQVQLCKNNKLTTLNDGKELQEEKKREEEEKKRNAKEEGVKKEFHNIVISINQIGADNLTEKQLIDFINQYMKFLDNHSDNYYGIYDIAIKNLAILKKEYASRFPLFCYTVTDSSMLVDNPKIGMTKNEVLALTEYVKPKDINTTTTKYGTHDQYVYYNDYLYFEDGILTSIQD